MLARFWLTWVFSQSRETRLLKCHSEALLAPRNLLFQIPPRHSQRTRNEKPNYEPLPPPSQAPRRMGRAAIYGSRPRPRPRRLQTLGRQRPLRFRRRSSSATRNEKRGTRNQV